MLIVSQCSAIHGELCIRFHLRDDVRVSSSLPISVLDKLHQVSGVRRLRKENKVYFELMMSSVCPDRPIMKASITARVQKGERDYMI